MDYEEEVMNEINTYKQIIEDLENKQYEYYFCICRNENYICDSRIEHRIDDRLNQFFKKSAIEFYKNKLNEARTELKKYL